MADAAALLWRLHLLGIDVGGRWNGIADSYAAEPAGRYAFSDAHAMMAYVGAGRDADAEALLAAQSAALEGPGDNAMFVAEVGQGACEGILAFGRGDYARSIEALRTVRNRAYRFGGSHAQRDILDLTLIEAARRAGEGALHRALLAEREMAAPLAEPQASRMAA